MAAGDDVLKALTILAKYTKKAGREGDLALVPEHDQVWIGHDIGPEYVDADDQKALEELGFSWDEGIPAWHSFV